MALIQLPYYELSTQSTGVGILVGLLNRNTIDYVRFFLHYLKDFFAYSEGIEMRENLAFFLNRLREKMSRLEGRELPSSEQVRLAGYQQQLESRLPSERVGIARGPFFQDPPSPGLPENSECCRIN